MSEDIRAIMAQTQWEITKGHLRACVVLRGGRRLTDKPPTVAEDKKRHADWERFQTAIEDFIVSIENEGWVE